MHRGDCMERPVRVVVGGFFGLWSAFSLGLASIACGGVAPDPNAAADVHVEAGVRALRDARPDVARDDFEAALLIRPGHTEAAFGLALSEALMLPESPAGQGALDALGLRRVAMVADVFGPSGILADLARGLEFEALRLQARATLGLDAADTADLNTLLSRMPPSTSASTLAAHLEGLADHLAPIATWFEAAAQPEFSMIIPGALFHLEGDLAVGPGEAAALAGATRVARAALMAVAAYGWSERPLAELGELSTAERAAALSVFIAEATPPADLIGPAAEGRRGMEALLGALGAHASTPRGSLVAWDLLPREGADRVVALLEATARATEGAVTLPDTSPATSLDLSVAIHAPPALPDEALIVDAEGLIGVRPGVLADLSAVVAQPPLAVDPTPSPALFVHGRPTEGWLGRWLDPLLSRLEVDLGL